MIQSANDGCIALAEGIAGNETEFVRMMNDRAREIGLTKSYFTNVDGLPDPKMRVTPRELGHDRAPHRAELSRLLQMVRRARIHLEQDPPAKPQSAARRLRRRRRHEDRLHQRGRLQPGRLGGAKRRAADRRPHRLEERQGPRRRRQEAARLRLQEFRGHGCCSPKARPSPRPRSLAARKAAFRSPPRARSS